LEQPSPQRSDILERLQRVDRRYIFLLMAAAIIVPTLLRVRLPVGEATRPVRMVYDGIAGLPPGSVVMMAFDFGPASAPELTPMAAAILRHCFARDLKVVALTFYTVGPPMAQSVLDEVAKEFGKTYGEDYVNLGFQPVMLAALISMATDIPGTYPQDYTEHKMSDLPLMDHVRSYDDIALVVDLASSDTPFAWITVVNARYQEQIAAGVTAVMAVDCYPYIQSKQLVGMLGGLKGAAEYEALVEHAGDATRRMPAQSFAHGLIILFVLLGNAGYVIVRARARRRA
jgi:hypothetical protein